MDSVVELEKHVMQDLKKASPEDLDILARHYWDLAPRSQDFRDRRSHLKRSSLFAGLAFAAGVDAVERLELCRTIVQRAAESVCVASVLPRAGWGGDVAASAARPSLGAPNREATPGRGISRVESAAGLC